MIETMGQCLRAWMDEEQLTSIQVAEIAGYKSKTSVARVLRDNLEEKALLQFYDSMQPHLNQAWKERFHQALAVSRIGLENYRMFEAMDRNLFAGPQVWRAPEKTVELPDAEKTLHVAGCPWQEAIDMIAGMKTQYPGLQVRRYLTEEELLSSPETFEEILAHITDPAWQVFLVRNEALTARRQPWHFCVLDHGPEKPGEVRMPGQERWIGYEIPLEDKKMLLHLLEDLNGGALYVNDELETGANYINFTKKCYELEKGRKMAAIRPTPGIQMFPFSVARDSFTEYLSTVRDPLAVAKDTLMYVHEKRVRNFYQREKGTTLILSENGMKEFARTGRLPDQFFAFRTFSRPERETIFRTLMEFTGRKGVDMLIRKGDQGPLSMEIYQGQGAIVYPSNSSYTSRERYRELRLTGERLEKLCWTYATHVASGEKVIPAGKTLQTLLIRNAT